jgi:hypothetical protein
MGGVGPDGINHVAVIAVIVTVRPLTAALMLWGVRRRALGVGAVRVMSSLLFLGAIGTMAISHIELLGLAALFVLTARDHWDGSVSQVTS